MKKNEELVKLLAFLKIPYKNINLYITSFTHKSYSNEFGGEYNERLEFIGDAILDFLVGEYLFLTYPTLDEGNLSKLRAKYVCEDANNAYCLKLGLDKLFRIGKGEEDTGGRMKKALLADLFEAFLGAVYLDTDSIEVVRSILKLVVFDSIDKKEFDITDYKSILQEYMQAEKRDTVTYVLDQGTGPAHDPTFYVSVYYEGIRLGSGVGKTKKEAQQQAAKVALEKLAK